MDADPESTSNVCDVCVQCPACEAPVQVGRRTIGDLLACPTCRAGFRVTLEIERREGQGSAYATSVRVSAEDPARAAVEERFQVVGVLGRGGQSEVLRVRPRSGATDFALKFLDAVATAAQELSAGLAHPNIVALHAIGRACGPAGAGRAYAIYEIVEGRTLAALIAEGPLPVPRALELAFQIVEGLVHSHSQGIVHRDLKPENILVTRNGVAKIADFGIGRFIGDRARVDFRAREPFVGTPGYSAPEQIEGWGAVRATDVYGFGMTLYEALTGRLPFEAPSLEILLHHQVHTAPRDPVILRSDLPPALGRLVLDCLNKDPAERPQTAEAVRDRLRTIASSLDLPIPIVPARVPLESPALASAAGFRLAWRRAVGSALVLALPLLVEGASPIWPGLAGWSIVLVAAWVLACGLFVELVAHQVTGTGGGWRLLAFAEMGLAAVPALSAVGTLVLISIGLRFASGMPSEPAHTGMIVGSMVLQTLAGWVLLAPIVVLWIQDGLAAEARQLVQTGQALLDLSGPSDITVNLGGNPALPLPHRVVLRRGAHELRARCGPRARVLRIEVDEPALLAVTLRNTPEGPMVGPSPAVSGPKERAGALPILVPLVGASLAFGVVFYAGSIGLGKLVRVLHQAKVELEFSSVDRLLRQGQWEKADGECRRLLARKRGPDLLARSAAAARGAGGWKVALERVQGAMREYPGSAVLAEELGQVLAGSSAPAVARGALRYALTLDPGRSGIEGRIASWEREAKLPDRGPNQTLLDLAGWLIEHDVPWDAVRVFELVRAREELPDWALLAHGQQLDKAGRRADAIEAFRKLKTRWPQNPIVNQALLDWTGKRP